MAANLQRPLLLLLLLCACDSLTPDDGDASVQRGGQTALEPLPSDLVSACPESQRFDRSGSGPCTAVGCQDGYNLNVSPSSGLAMGAYTFELSIDSRTVICQGSLPLKDCSERSFRCDAEDVRLGESGCALQPNQQGIANIAFDGYPLALSVRVLKDGEELRSVELKPTYSASQPNGPGCDPICCSAAGALELF